MKTMKKKKVEVKSQKRLQKALALMPKKLRVKPEKTYRHYDRD